MNKIAILRKEKGISQSELAKIIGVGEKAISSYETERTSPSMEVAKKLADYFDTSIDYLIGRIDENNIKTVFIEKEQKLSIDEEALLKAYRKCSDAGKQYLINKAEVIAFEEKSEEQTATAEQKLLA